MVSSARRRSPVAGLALIATVAAATATPAAADDEPGLLLATTTSVRDSGLLDELLPLFTQRAGTAVQTIAVGSGAALRMGSEGNADVLLTHAPEAEAELVASGAAVARRPFMENHFLIAGPPEDPAGIAGVRPAAEALRRIAALPAPYVSRGDDSGTHKHEVALLTAAGLDPEGGWPGFVQTGAGMGASLQVAGERRAYLLSDAGTFLAFAERVGLVALSSPAPDLRNVYSVLRINPERFPGRIQADAARELEEFLVARETQRRIAEFGKRRFGRPLFRAMLLERASADEP